VSDANRFMCRLAETAYNLVWRRLELLVPDQ